MQCLLDFLAGKTGMGEVEARLLKCDNSTQDEQEWVLHSDPRASSVYDRFVAGKLLTTGYRPLKFTFNY